MAVKIRLKRIGKKKQPTYRVVVADSRAPRDGRIIESIGRYDPRQDPSIVEIDNERAQYWLGVGAQPTERAQKLLEISGAVERSKASTPGVYHLEPETEAVPPASEAAAEPAVGSEPESAEPAVEQTDDQSTEKPAEEEAPATDEPSEKSADAGEGDET